MKRDDNVAKMLIDEMYDIKYYDTTLLETMKLYF